MQQWKMLAEKIDALTRRERVMVLVGVLALIWVVLSTVLLDPVLRQKKTLENQLASDVGQVEVLRQQLQVLQNTPIQDPDVNNRLRLKTISQQDNEVKALLVDMQKDLVSPDKMAGLLEGLLKKDAKLKLISLQSLVPTEASAKQLQVTKTESAVSQIEENAPKIAVYRHGVELKVQGDYLDLLHYLHTLEKLSWHMLWGNIDLKKMDATPQPVMTVTIYTLSLDKAWLSL